MSLSPPSTFLCIFNHERHFTRFTHDMPMRMQIGLGAAFYAFPNNNLGLCRRCVGIITLLCRRARLDRKRKTREDGVMDNDLEQMTRDDLIAEVKKLRQGIREHRDNTGHELCWHHPALWGLLPEKTDPVPAVPAWPQFLQGCLHYRQSLDEQAPGAERTDESYQK